MYVIVDIQGQQFKVEKDQKLFVHRIDAEPGATVEFEKVLLVDKGGVITVGTPVVEGAKVVAEVVPQKRVNPDTQEEETVSFLKGEKVLVFHKKRRKGHRKLNGHRQQFTQITVKEIIA